MKIILSIEKDEEPYSFEIFWQKLLWF